MGWEDISAPSYWITSEANVGGLCRVNVNLRRKQLPTQTLCLRRHSCGNECLIHGRTHWRRAAFPADEGSNLAAICTECPLSNKDCCVGLPGSLSVHAACCPILLHILRFVVRELQVCCAPGEVPPHAFSRFLALVVLGQQLAAGVRLRAVVVKRWLSAVQQQLLHVHAFAQTIRAVVGFGWSFLQPESTWVQQHLCGGRQAVSEPNV